MKKFLIILSGVMLSVPTILALVNQAAGGGGPDLPPNKLTCSTMHAGTVTFYDSTAAVATIKVQKVTQCVWTWPSEDNEGQVSYFNNPPITVITAAGQKVIFPSAYAYCYGCKN